LFNKATKTIGTFAKQIAVSLFPVVKQMLEGYLAWFKEFRKGGAETFSTGLKALVGSTWGKVQELRQGNDKALAALKFGE